MRLEHYEQHGLEDNGNVIYLKSVFPVIGHVENIVIEGKLIL